jgi:hypothetical protein
VWLLQNPATPWPHRPGYKWGRHQHQKKVVVGGRQEADIGFDQSSDNEIDAACNDDQGQDLSDGARQVPPGDVKRFFKKDDMGKEKNRHNQETDVKDEYDDGEDRLQAHASAPERRDPVEQ